MMTQPFCIWFPKRQIQVRYLEYIHSTTTLVKSITDKIASRDSDELAIEAVVENDRLSILNKKSDFALARWLNDETAVTGSS
jgi:ornithine carbamoyltransferase